MLLVVPVTLLAGCGDRGGDDPAVAGGDVPTTPRALAWIATQTLPDPDRASATDDFDELGRGSVGIEMRYGADGEYDGDLLALGVSDRLPKELVDCDANDYLSGCETLEDGVVLQWEEQVPEEDPGTVIVVVPRDEGAVALFQAGQDITGDPRELDLRIPVDEMVALGQDPRVAPTTTQEAVDGGEDLSFWVEVS